MMRAKALGESGQAHVEAALVLPLMVVFCLALIQLTCLQQARLATEYAAYCAARAGTVWNGSNERMRDAALLALLPTLGRTDGAEALGRTYDFARREDQALADLGLGRPDRELPEGFRPAPLLGMLRVDTVRPALRPELNGVWKLQDGAAWTELDFDGADAFPQTPDAEEHYALGAQDPAQRTLREATVLSIRLRYFYELRIPFVNWLVFVAWFAHNAGVHLGGPLERPTRVLEAGAGARGIQGTRGLEPLTRAEMQTLWGISTAGLPGLGRRFLVPLSATCSMRMQSNFFRKWLMHEESGSGP